MAKTTKRKSKLKSLLAFDTQMLTGAAQTYKHTCPDGFSGVIGIDEVGRGSLIGPVTAAAFVFRLPLEPKHRKALTDLDDSKATHLNHEKRCRLATVLKHVGCWGIGEASKEEVETINVVQASFLASYRAFQHLQKQFPEISVASCFTVMDGKLKLPGFEHPHGPVVKADSISAAVAAASIIAKAHRDAFVMELAEQHPGYGWETNAGYATPPHKKAMLELGLTPWHRQTYFYVKQAQEKRQQLLLPL